MIIKIKEEIFLLYRRCALDTQDLVKSRLGTNYPELILLGKFDFPRFNGDKEWLFKVEDFFSITFTPGKLKVKLVAIHFDGHVATLHQ